jgi:glycosyltransferase involved in cell wall biosynthesis
MGNLKKTERLRVLRIAHSSLTPALRERERALVRAHDNVDLQVLTTNRWKEAEIEVDALPDDLFPVRKARPLLSKHIQLFAYDPRPLIKALQDHKPHLIDMNHEPYSVACAQVLTTCQMYAPDAPIVMQTAQNIFKRYPFPFNWMEQRAFRRISAAYVCSETVREVLRAKGFSKPVPIIPFGVDVNAFAPSLRKPTTEAPVIGYVGRMLPGKGLDVLSGALREMRDDKWNLLVVGDGPERAKFTSDITDAGLLDRTRFTGAVSYDSTPEYFKQIDVLIVPTVTTEKIREQFGRVIVEAMASGVSVIGSTCGAIPEVIADAGLVVPEGDSNALAGAIRQLINDPSLREQFSREGRRRVEQNYTWEIVGKKTSELYEQVLSATKVFNPDLELAA